MREEEEDWEADDLASLVPVEEVGEVGDRETSIDGLRVAGQYVEYFVQVDAEVAACDELYNSWKSMLDRLMEDATRNPRVVQLIAELQKNLIALRVHRFSAIDGKADKVRMMIDQIVRVKALYAKIGSNEGGGSGLELLKVLEDRLRDMGSDLDGSQEKELPEGARVVVSKRGQLYVVDEEFNFLEGATVPKMTVSLMCLEGPDGEEVWEATDSEGNEVEVVDTGD